MEKNFEVKVTLKKSVLDPQGQVIKEALEHLGFNEAKDIRVGKSIEVKLDTDLDDVAAAEKVAEMCEKLLANTVIEDYFIEKV